MIDIIHWFESLFNTIPISLLEGWGRFGYAVGFLLMLAAFGGICFRPGGRWGLGRERQQWDTKALLSVALTFVLVIGTGYLGSFIVLVPGAQTFESLKDLSVFLCVVLMGRPALIAVPFAYGISDLAEGVPPDFLWDWIFGYFINPACFWVAFQLIGKNPDFRRGATWAWYGLFVLIFMSIEPQLWGYICSNKFTSDISYRNITPALFFTTSVTWVLAPFAMLLALPLARRFGLFWAEIPGHVKERRFWRTGWVWQSGHTQPQDFVSAQQGVPMRLFLAAPLVALVLVLVISVAFLTLNSGEKGANMLASRLHQEIALNIDLLVDDYLEKHQNDGTDLSPVDISLLLRGSSIASHGRAFLLDRSGVLIASSTEDSPDSYRGQPAWNNKDKVIDQAARALYQHIGSLAQANKAIPFRFDIVTAKPLSRETWLAQATPYADRRGRVDWIEITAMPESAYLGEVRAGNSQSAVVLAIALTAALFIALLLAGVVAAPLRRMSRSAQALADGDLSQRVTSSRLEEIDMLAGYFNDMAQRLERTMANIEAEVAEQTRMKEALSQLSDRLQLATRAANIGIWEWNVINDELIWDEAMYGLYGIRKEDFGGAYEAWVSSVHPDEQIRAHEAIQAALSGEREFNHEFSIVWPLDGSTHVIKGIGQTLRDASGKPLRMIGMNVDITESRRAEEEVNRHRLHLEELVAERTAELTVARDQADQANRSKSIFLSNMSHEIRTPLNAIMGMTYLALRNEIDPLQRSYLKKVDAAAQGLLGIINDILDLSKIEAGKLDLEQAPFVLDDLLIHLRDLVAVKAQEKGLLLDFSMAPGLNTRLLGDELRLGQVLLNLVSNAVKFTEAGKVSLYISCLERTPRELYLQFDVTDTGIGMTREQSQRLFRPFEQADISTARKFGGTGLGLSISKKLVEMMGGRIWVETALGQGSRFSFTVRLALQTEQDIQLRRYERLDQGYEAALRIAGSHVLLVEDNDINQELAVSLLTTAGVSVDVANNGLEALSMAATKTYDAVLMDCQMPVMDGYDTTREMRKDARFSSLPILAMSANVMAGDKEKCLEAGMDDYISKPINVAQLFKTLALWIKPQRRPLEHSATKSATDAQTGVSLAGVDTATALKRLNGNKAIYRKLLVMFHQRQGDAVGRITAAWANGDRGEAMRIAHTLKSLAGNIGADALFSAAANLERAMQAGELESVEGLLMAIALPLDGLMQGIETFLAAPLGDF